MTHHVYTEEQAVLLHPPRRTPLPVMAFLLLAAWTAGSAWGAEVPSTPADRFLGAQGTTLRDRHGQGAVVQLRGANLGAWLKWEAWMSPIDSGKSLKEVNPGHNGYEFQARRLLTTRFGAGVADELITTYKDAWITAADLDQLQVLGMNAVRLPLCYDHLLHEDGTWRSDAFRHVDWLVAEAWKRGIYTILDYHGFLPPGAEEDGSATGYFANRAQQDETVRIWTHLAERYRGNPAVAMYDLLNEPNNSAPKGKAEPTSATVCDLYDRLYQAIRRVDPDHLIAMEGMWGWETLRDPAKAGYSNVVCSLHWYHWGKMDTGKQRVATAQDLQGVARMGEQWKIPCYIGEFNYFGDQSAWAEGIRAYDGAGLGWTMWAYKNKAAGSNSWGICTTIPGKAPPIPDLGRDSADTIRAAWKAWATNDQAFALNPMLKPVLLAR